MSVNLTPREVEVIELLCEGLTDKHIANELGISPKTVAHHLEHVLDKTRLQHSLLNKRILLVRWALREGLIKALCVMLCIGFLSAGDDALRVGRLRVRGGSSWVRRSGV